MFLKSARSQVQLSIPPHTESLAAVRDSDFKKAAGQKSAKILIL
jgi:hypothetical protein